MKKKISIALFILIFCSGSAIWAGRGGSSFAGGMAGGMMGGLISGAMTKSNGGNRNAMQAVQNLEHAVKIDLMNMNSKINNLEFQLNDIRNKLNEISAKIK